MSTAARNASRSASERQRPRSTRVPDGVDRVGEKLHVRGLDETPAAADDVHRARLRERVVVAEVLATSDQWHAPRPSPRSGTSMGPSKVTRIGSVARVVCTISPLTRISSVSTGAIDTTSAFTRIVVGADAGTRDLVARFASVHLQQEHRPGREERATALHRFESSSAE